MPEENVVMCDIYPDKRAVATYLWDWGEAGHCSAEGRFLLAQRSKTLKRGVQFSTLMQAPPPVTRDERTQLLAARMSAEQETEEYKRKNGELMATADRLRAELRRLAASDAHKGEQLKEAKGSLDDLTSRYHDALADLAECREQLELLRSTLPEPEPEQPEQEPVTRVEGERIG